MFSIEFNLKILPSNLKSPEFNSNMIEFLYEPLNFLPLQATLNKVFGVNMIPFSELQLRAFQS